MSFILHFCKYILLHPWHWTCKSMKTNTERNSKLCAWFTKGQCPPMWHEMQKKKKLSIIFMTSTKAYNRRTKWTHTGLPVSYPLIFHWTFLTTQFYFYLDRVTLWSITGILSIGSPSILALISGFQVVKVSAQATSIYLKLLNCFDPHYNFVKYISNTYLFVLTYLRSTLWIRF